MCCRELAELTLSKVYNGYGKMCSVFGLKIDFDLLKVVLSLNPKAEVDLRI